MPFPGVLGMLSASTSSQSLTGQNWALAACLEQLQLLEFSPGTSHTHVQTEQTTCQLRHCPDLLSILQHFRTRFANWAGGKPGGKPGFALEFAKCRQGTIPPDSPTSGQPCQGGSGPWLTSLQHLELLNVTQCCSSDSGTHVDALLLC